MEKKGVLVVAHGSRAENTIKTFNHIVELAKAKLPDLLIEAAYMEFCPETIASGLTKLEAKGVTKVKVVPYFLFEGIHIKEDIPGEIEAFAKEHPQMEITLGETLGADPRLADILADRILG